MRREVKRHHRESGISQEICHEFPQTNAGIKFHTSGPLLGAYFAERDEYSTLEEVYDVCLCSQSGVSRIGAKGQFAEILMQSNDTLLKHLARRKPDAGNV